MKKNNNLLITALCFVPSVLSRIRTISMLGTSIYVNISSIVTAVLPLALLLLIIVGILIKRPLLIGIVSVINTIIGVATTFTYAKTLFSSVAVFPGQVEVFFYLSIVRSAIGTLASVFLAIACFLPDRNKGKVVCSISVVAVFVQTVFSIVFFKPVTASMIIVNICYIVGTVLIGRFVIGQQN